MLGSLRFRLPALFLLGIVLAGVVAALISLRLFQTYTRSQSIQELLVVVTERIVAAAQLAHGGVAGRGFAKPFPDEVIALEFASVH